MSPTTKNENKTNNNGRGHDDEYCHGKCAEAVGQWEAEGVGQSAVPAV